jgi:cytochrome c-type biogenesis protein CcmF
MVELAHILLILSFAFSNFQFVSSLFCIRTNDVNYLKYCYISNSVTFFCVSISFLILIYSFVSSDFSVKIVFENSHYLMPNIYKFFAVWGNHEGSMFLWVWVLNLTGFILWIWLERNNSDIKFKSYVMSIQALIYMIFFIYLLFLSNPFSRLFPVPMQGNDLNPLLQDIGLILHPPILYIGYVGVSSIYILVIASLFNNHIDYKLNNLIRPWALLSWSFLTLGIALGSWWAYYELGWGGFWFWDPVENISLMPWLILGALLHTILLNRKDNKFQKWVVILSIGSFGFSLFGSFLVRSGILNSIHSFSSDPLRGIYLMGIFFVLIAGGYLLYAVKYNYIFNNSGEKQTKFLDKVLILKVLLILTILFVVVIATVYPIFLEFLTGYKISVGTGYFETTFVPLSIFILIIMGFITIYNFKKFIYYILIPLILSTIYVCWLLDVKSFIVVCGIAISLWVCITALYNLKDKIRKKSFFAIGGLISHFGAGVLALGITGTTTLSKDYIANVKVGESKKFDEVIVSLEKLHTGVENNYNFLKAEVKVKIKDKKYLFYPEKRKFSNRGMVTVETAIKHTLLYDVMVAIGNIDGEKIMIKVYKKSMVTWIWIGAFIMFLGGFISSLYRLRNRKKQ